MSACDPSIWGTETGLVTVPGQHGLPSESLLTRPGLVFTAIIPDIWKAEIRRITV
jgi:hypothetical protein